MHKTEFRLGNMNCHQKLPARWTRQVSERRQPAERWRIQICPHPVTWRSTQPKPNLNSPLVELYIGTCSFSNDTSLLTGSFSYGIPLWVIHMPTRYEFSILFTSDFYLKRYRSGYLVLQLVQP